MIIGIIIVAVFALVAVLFLKEALRIIFWDIPRAMIRGYKGKVDPDAPTREELPDWAQENPSDPTKGWAGF